MTHVDDRAATGARHRMSAWVDAQIAQIVDAGQWRALRTLDGRGQIGALADGTQVVSYASNDYFGLSTHPAVAAAAHAAIDRYGTGATSSRLVVGSRPVHAELESTLAAWKRTDAAVVFPTGFAANIGVLSTFGGPDCLIVSDELNHASIIDGCRLSRSPSAIARHNDVDHVDHLLTESPLDRAIVVTDAVFSMDGDEANVDELAEVCARHGALLVLDEAHSVFGPAVDHLVDSEVVDILRIPTLSKSLGSQGGAVCGSRGSIDLLVNRARSLIFTTGLSPADAAAAQAAINVVRSPEGEALLQQLQRSTDRLAPGHPSPIVPIIVGEEAHAVEASERLLDRGLLVPAIRPPTVAPGTSRLRIALSAAHTDAMIDNLIAGLRDSGLR